MDEWGNVSLPVFADVSAISIGLLRVGFVSRRTNVRQMGFFEKKISVRTTRWKSPTVVKKAPRLAMIREFFLRLSENS